jgi:predicted ABC-class ATPase
VWDNMRRLTPGRNGARGAGALAAGDRDGRRFRGLPRAELRRILARIDGRPFGAYRDLVGSYDFGSFRLDIEHVQPDPFAPATRLRVTVPAEVAALDPADWADPVRRVAVEDWLLRRLAAALARSADPEGTTRPEPPLPGSGPVPRPPAEAALPAGCLRVLVPGQQVLERSAMAVRPGGIEVRMLCDLPAERRQVLAARAAAALDVALPAAIAAMLPRTEADRASLRAHVELMEDQEALRAELLRRGWVAFLADGSLLPRASGISDLPLRDPSAVRLVAPEGLAATVRLPHRGEVRGLAIPQGVTLVVGGAYHGKSTLLRAIERGVYNHVAGDGRELCITRADAVSIAAEDGRPVAGVDISAFVRPLPGGADTRAFRTLAASGSTSQAAGLCEALEMGARCLLLDEDRSAANFMSRDARMRRLVPDEEDPVVPFADRVRWLWEAHGVSTVLVVGGAGAFLDVADCVVRMRAYQPEDATVRAREIARELPVPRPTPPEPGPVGVPRVPAPDAFGAGPGRLRVRARGGRVLVVGDTPVDLGALSQIVEEAQMHALADMLAHAARYCDGRRTLAEVVAEVMADLDRLGFGAISPWAGQCPGNYARPRAFELAAAINRLPGLRLAGDATAPARPQSHRPWRRPARAPAVRPRTDRGEGLPRPDGPRDAPASADPPQSPPRAPRRLLRPSAAGLYLPQPRPAARRGQAGGTSVKGTQT